MRKFEKRLITLIMTAVLAMTSVPIEALASEISGSTVSTVSDSSDNSENVSTEAAIEENAITESSSDYVEVESASEENLLETVDSEESAETNEGIESTQETTGIDEGVPEEIMTETSEYSSPEEETDAENETEYVTVSGNTLETAETGDIASGFVSNDKGGITWRIDANGHLTVNGSGEISTSSLASRAPWFEYRNQIRSGEINLSGIKDASYFFSGCHYLTELDISGFDTSQVTDMSRMFNGCGNLTELDLSSFDTSQVTDMSRMFNGCGSLTELDLSSFDTSQVTDMNHMFYGCDSLTELDVSNFDTSQVTNMNGMFEIDRDSSLKELDLSSFDTSQVTSMSHMFDDCNSLKELDLSSFDTSQVTDMSGMFYHCRALTELDLSSFDTSQVTDMSWMFDYCGNLTELDLSSFDTSQVTNMSGMFYDCDSLTELDVGSFDTSQVTDMSGMFFYCGSLTELDLSSFDTSQVTSMGGMFELCRSLSKIYSPYNVSCEAELPQSKSTDIWYLSDGTKVTSLPKGLDHSVVIQRNQITSEDDKPSLGLTIASNGGIKAENRVYPNYNIVANIQNLGDGPVKNTVCQIQLPKYLEFVDPKEQGTIRLGEVKAGQMVLVERKVRVVGVPKAGVSTEYTVSVSADNAETKTLTKQITIGPRENIEYHNSINELSTLDYLAFSKVVYEKFTIGQTVQECLMNIEGNKWDNVFLDEYGIKYSELCGPISQWKAAYIRDNPDTGFYAVLFKNTGGGAVLAIRGSEGKFYDALDDVALKDWFLNDYPLILFNTEGDKSQFSDAVIAYNKSLDEEGVSEVRVTGHSLGGLWGDVICAYSGCQGRTFNAITGLDVIYYKNPSEMGKNFQGVNKWNFMDYANEYDALAGMTEVFVTPFGGTMLKPFYKFDSNFGALSIAANHGLKSLVSRDSQGSLRMNDANGVWWPTSVVTNYMAMTNHSIDMGTSNTDYINKGLSVAVARASYGGDGNDNIYTGILGDKLIGGNETDTIDGGWGDDNYYYFKGNGTDFIHDVDGSDRLYLFDFAENDRITLDSSNDAYIDVRCNNHLIVRIDKKGRAWSIGDSDTFKIYMHRPGQKTSEFDVFDVTSYFNTQKYSERIVLCCPINIEVVDSNGNVVYVLEDGEIGTYYTEYGNFYIFEEEDGGYGKVVELVEGYEARIIGVDEGTMEIDHRDASDGDLEDDAKIFTSVPVSESFIASLEETEDDEMVLRADRDGDGIVDAKIGYDGKVILAETINLSHEYVAMKPEEQLQISADVQPKILEEFLKLSIEAGGENVISLDEAGNVIARQTGTAYVVAEVNSGENIITARCRIDVAEDEINAGQNKIKLDGIQLITEKVTSELFSTDYTELELLLLLPQNLSIMSLEAGFVPEDNGVAIDSVRFNDQETSKVFDLKALDDRRIVAVPTKYALNNPDEIDSSYVSAVTVCVDGTEYTTTEKVTLMVKKSVPKLKASIAPFNSFYTGQKQEIIVSGGTMTKAIEKSIPDWLTLNHDSTLSLNEIAADSNKGKVVLLVETKEWNVPAEVSFEVKNSYKAPGLKLAVSAVKMTADAENSRGVVLKLLPKNKKDTLVSLNVTGIVAPDGYTVENFNTDTGEFILKTQNGFGAGKIALQVQIGGTEEIIELPLNVALEPVSLKLSNKSVTLNTAAEDSVSVVVTSTPEDYILTDLVIKGNEAEELNVGFANGVLNIQTTERTKTNAEYKLSISAGGGTETVLTVKTTYKKPSVSLKVKGKLDLSFLDNWIDINTSFKNYNGQILALSEVVKAPDGSYSDAFRFALNGNDIKVSCKDENIATGTYKVTLDIALADGEQIEAKTTLTVKRTAVKLKLSASKLNLNKAIGEREIVEVSCAAKDYVLEQPIWRVMDKNKKYNADSELDVEVLDGKLIVATNNFTQYGTSYKVLVQANEYSPVSTLTVNILTHAKSEVTVAIKTSGKMDVIRDGSAVVAAVNYKNCNRLTARQECIQILDQYGNVIADASWERNPVVDFKVDIQGRYVLTRVPGANLNHTEKYKVKVITYFNNGYVAENSKELNLKMGDTKLKLTPGSVTLYPKDRYSRAEFSLKSSDAQLNAIEKVICNDERFVAYNYENGELALGFAENTVKSNLLGKTVTVSLNIFLDGNETDKANSVVKLKVKVPAIETRVEENKPDETDKEEQNGLLAATDLEWSDTYPGRALFYNPNSKAISAQVVLYKNGEVFHTRNFGIPENLHEISVDFYEDICDLGIYTFRVLIGENNSTTEDISGEYSELSPAFEYARPSKSVSIPENIKVVGNSITWDKVENATKYRVNIYCADNGEESGYAVFTTQIVFANSTIFTKPPFEGEFYVTVTAISKNINQWANGEESEMIPLTQTGESDSNELLAATELEWSATNPGVAYFHDPNEMNTSERLILYKDGELVNDLHYMLARDITNRDFAANLAGCINESGTYTFQVLMSESGMDETETVWKYSDMSPEYVYVRPNAQVGIPQNIELIGDAVRWDSVENAARYLVRFYYVDGGWEEGAVISVANITDNNSVRYSGSSYSGEPYVTVTAISKNINQWANGMESEPISLRQTSE